MNAEKKSLIEAKYSELESLTKHMDLPDFRRTSVQWLVRNMKVKNGSHQNFNKAMEVVVELSRMGVR